MTSRFSSRAIPALALVAALTIAVGCQLGVDKKDKKEEKEPDRVKVTPTPFSDHNKENGDVYNASGIVPLADSQFLVVDNNTNDALLELDLDGGGRQMHALVHRPLVGLPEDSVDDMEDLALAEENGTRYVFATPSLSVKAGSKKRGKEQKVRPSGLVRVTIGADGSLATDVMPEFRDWLVERTPLLSRASDNDPDYGGLNIEGLAWDPDRHALLFGIRTPVIGHSPVVLPVKIKDLKGPLAPSNLDLMAPVQLHVERVGSDQGIRGMSRGPDGKGFLLTVANATSNDAAGFSLYRWDGSNDGRVERLPVAFDNDMKPEGLTVGTVGGRPAIVFTDDGGGYQVLWLDEVPEATSDR